MSLNSLLLFLALTSNEGAFANRTCEVSGKSLEAFLRLSYIAFDETEPKGGWRDLYARECYLEAAKIIDVYQLHHLATLTAAEKRMLTWHAGQNYANEGLKDVALTRFKQCFDPQEKAQDEIQWNAYVKGTIAFIEGNTDELKSTRDELAKMKKAPWSLKILNNLLECIGFPYREIGGKCRPKGP